MESEEIVGKWWLPGQPDHSIFGTCAFSDGQKVILELVGLFEESNRAAPEIILGLTDKAKEITLVHCLLFEQSGTVAEQSVDRSKYVCRMVILGGHHSTFEEISFDRFTSRFSSLAEWTNQPLDITSSIQDIIGKINDVLHGAVEDFEFDIRTRWSVSHSIHEVKLSQQAWVSLVARKRSHVNDLLKYLDDVQDFISLLVGVPIYIKQISAVLKELPVSQEIWFVSDRWLKPGVREFHSVNLATSAIGLREQFNQFLGNWFRKKEQLATSVDLFFATVYADRMYLSLQFLLLAQALEVLHRSVRTGDYLPPEEFNTARKAFWPEIRKVLDDHKVSTELQNSIRVRIEFANQYSLKERIEDMVKWLLRDSESTMQEIVGDVNSFAKTVKNHRNYLTHYSSDSGIAAGDVDTLYLYVLRLRCLLQLAFYQEIGYSPTDSVVILKKSLNYRYLVELKT